MATPPRIVITGGQGFVGQHLQQELQRQWRGAELISWDQPQHDITNPDTYAAELEQLKPTWLVHLAAISPVSESFRDPARVHHINVEGTRRLLEVCVTVSPQTKVLAVSSSDIYGKSSSAPLLELPLGDVVPKNPYGESKLVMERLIVDQFNDMVLRVRPFPHIGPGQRQGFVTADFASQIASIESGRQAPVIKVGNLASQRDFTDIRDVVKAYRLLMEKAPLGEVFHIASGRAVSIQSILDKLLQLSTVTITVEKDPTRLRPSDVPIMVGDASKLKVLTGWEATIPLDQSLSDVLTYWREQVKYAR